MSEIEQIREALDLGLQAWRTTPVREKFLTAMRHLDGAVGLLRDGAVLLTAEQVRTLHDGLDSPDPQVRRRIAVQLAGRISHAALDRKLAERTEPNGEEKLRQA